MNNEKQLEKLDILLIEENPNHATLVIDQWNEVNTAKKIERYSGAIYF